MITWQITEYFSLFPLAFRVLTANLGRKNDPKHRIDFGQDPSQHALYFPPRHTPLPDAPVVAFIPGGGWRMGSPAQFSFIGRFFADRGYHTFVLGYRLAPGHKFPSQIDDVSKGIDACRDFSAHKGISHSGVIIGGQSAGAQLAALLAFDPSRQKTDRNIRGVFLISGPLDFSVCTNKTIQKMLHDYIGNDRDWSPADPIQYAAADRQVPLLLIHGAKDPLVDVANSRSFYDSSNKSMTTLCEVKKAHHSDLVGLFLNGWTKISAKMLDWMAHV